mmetsp:Transcript_38954/g.93513  ORF Transcript_38954/g.93513 Transcript_38954/m.93513 type:complete len:225 (+) Transcript_38954:131-805(+)
MGDVLEVVRFGRVHCVRVVAGHVLLRLLLGDVLQGHGHPLSEILHKSLLLGHHIMQALLLAHQREDVPCQAALRRSDLLADVGTTGPGGGLLEGPQFGVKVVRGTFHFPRLVPAAARPLHRHIPRPRHVVVPVHLPPHRPRADRGPVQDDEHVDQGVQEPLRVVGELGGLEGGAQPGLVEGLEDFRVQARAPVLRQQQPVRTGVHQSVQHTNSQGAPHPARHEL